MDVSATETLTEAHRGLYLIVALVFIAQVGGGRGAVDSNLQSCKMALPDRQVCVDTLSSLHAGVASLPGYNTAALPLHAAGPRWPGTVLRRMRLCF